jgi:hypothetical protein
MNWNKAEINPPTEEALLIWLDDGTFCVGYFDVMDFFDENGEWLPHATHWAEVTPPTETV